MRQRDPYGVLGVPRDATPDQITASYRALVRALHPDTHGEPADADRLADVLAAYALLRAPRHGETYGVERPATTLRAPDPIPVPVPVHIRHRRQRPPPDIRAGPVRRHVG